MPCLGFNIPAFKYCPAAQLMAKVKDKAKALQMQENSHLRNYINYYRNFLKAILLYPSVGDKMDNKQDIQAHTLELLISSELV